MIKEINIINSDIVLNSLRILIMMAKFETKKSTKMNVDTIMLYDFYMKFPQTMINSMNIDKHKEEMDFNEYYSYYHWHPDRDEYYLFLKYLLGKELINKRNTGNEFCYEINSRGKNVISKLSTNYAKKLNQSVDYIRKELSKKSNKQIEEAILIYCLNKG